MAEAAKTSAMARAAPSSKPVETAHVEEKKKPTEEGTQTIATDSQAHQRKNDAEEKKKLAEDGTQTVETDSQAHVRNEDAGVESGSSQDEDGVIDVASPRGDLEALWENHKKAVVSKDLQGAAKEENDAKKKAEDEAKKLKDEMEATKLKQETEAKKKAEDEVKRKIDEGAKQKAEEDARKRAEEEAKRLEEEVEAKKKAEDDAKKKLEEVEAKKKAEEEARRKADETAAAKKRKEEEEAKKKKADEEDAKKRTDDEEGKKTVVDVVDAAANTPSNFDPEENDNDEEHVASAAVLGGGRKKPAPAGRRRTASRATIRDQAKQAQQQRDEEEKALETALNQQVSEMEPEVKERLVVGGSVAEKRKSLAAAIPMGALMGGSPMARRKSITPPSSGAGGEEVERPVTASHTAPQVAMGMGDLSNALGSLRKRPTAPPANPDQATAKPASAPLKPSELRAAKIAAAKAQTPSKDESSGKSDFLLDSLKELEQPPSRDTANEGTRKPAPLPAAAKLQTQSKDRPPSKADILLDSLKELEQTPSRVSMSDIAYEDMLKPAPSPRLQELNGLIKEAQEVVAAPVVTAPPVDEGPGKRRLLEAVSPYESSGSDQEDEAPKQVEVLPPTIVVAPPANRVLGQLKDANLVSPSPLASRQSMHVVEVNEEDDSSFSE